MRHVIRETITLIRIERWFVADEQTGESELLPDSEHVVEELILSTAEEAQVRELFRRILAEQRSKRSEV
jgi:hypothetical protein